jgi:hypothetical protein
MKRRARGNLERRHPVGGSRASCSQIAGKMRANRTQDACAPVTNSTHILRAVTITAFHEQFFEAPACPQKYSWLTM